MHVAAFLVGVFALLGSAAPEIRDRGYQDCKKAVLACPKKRDECSLFLKATVTPCPRTKTTTMTAAATVTDTVTTVYTTHTEIVFSTTTFTSTSTLTVQPNIDIAIKRANPTCPSVSKPTKLPASVSKRCDKDSYASACRAIGVREKTTTLPARTVTQTKTISATVTSKAVISVATTIKVTSVTTVQETAVVTETVIPGLEVCSYLALRSDLFNGYLGANLDMGGWYPTFVLEQKYARQWEISSEREGTLSIMGVEAFASTDTRPLLAASVNADTFRFATIASQSMLTCKFVDQILQCTSTATMGKSRSNTILCKVINSAGFANYYIGFSEDESPLTATGIECAPLTIEAASCISD